MSWKERKLITVLSVILAALAIALVLVLAMRYRENRTVLEDSPSGELSQPVSQDLFCALSYNNGATTLSFELDEEGVWHWDVDQEMPLDDSVILDILSLLMDWQPQQTLTDSAALEASGLTEPTGSLTAVTENGDRTTLLFGRTTTDGASRYVRLNEDETTVYIVDDGLFRLMEVPVYDMCRLPDLPVLEESRIQGITLFGPEQDGVSLTTSFLPQYTDGSDYVSWRVDGANVTDDPLLQSLLEDLTALSFSKCVDYAPSEEAVSICGLNTPSAVLKVTYVTENGTEESLKLLIGNQNSEKTGRFVQLEGNDAIYLLEAELLDPLMQIAANGLDG